MDDECASKRLAAQSNYLAMEQEPELLIAKLTFIFKLLISRVTKLMEVQLQTLPKDIDSPQILSKFLSSNELRIQSVHHRV